MAAATPGRAGGQPAEKRLVYAIVQPPPTLGPGQQQQQQQTFASNSIRTTKYTVLTFLPKNLGEQFSRLANVFFLVLVVIQFIPSLSIINPYFNAFPLFLVITLSAGRDAYEDWRRSCSDNVINKSPVTCMVGGGWRNVNTPFFAAEGAWQRVCSALRPRRPSTITPSASSHSLRQGAPSPSAAAASSTASWATKQWNALRVGDFVLLREDDSIPADILVLASALPSGGCFVETKNLDGENNLKAKSCVEPTRSLTTAQECAELVCVVECLPPNSSLHLFNGTVQVGSSPKLPIGIHNLLLRGCILRNTPWVIGLVLYTGNDSKVVLNGGAAPTKLSMISRTLNWLICINLLLVFGLCVADAIINPIWLTDNNEPGNPWLVSSYGQVDSDSASGFAVFWASLNIYRNIIPISLYITIEVVQSLQAFFIYNDLGLYYDELDLPCVPRAWKLSDDLGQVSHIFSDKTGTLTQNILKFKGCSVAGLLLRDEAPADIKGAPFRNQQLSVLSESHPQVMAFLLYMSICHTAVVSKRSAESEGGAPSYTYKSESPDEEALLDAARDAGYIFTGQEEGILSVEALGVPMHFTLLYVLEFNSTRKRMSVIVRDAQGDVRLICKGADSVIKVRLAPGQPVLEETYRHIEEFAVVGLRTLCIATKVIPPGVFAEWEGRYKKAALALEDRDLQLDGMAEEMEVGLNLVGATAVEDKLQVGVPECIQSLAEAGIILWVLTGDKIETAINIGYSCNLLKRTMDLLIISTPDHEDGPEIWRQLTAALGHFAPRPLKEVGAGLSKDGKRVALVIDGYALAHAMKPESRDIFLQVSSLCAAVVCARVSPLQKAEVVNCVKSSHSKVTLAIGDGANDVGMIHAAHIGVGITGKEGMQATMASDYAFGQFRFLSRLLLVQGHWAYVRTSSMVLLFIHKSFIFTMILFWYQYFCGYSSELLYDFTYLLLYNVIFTVLSVGLVGAFDQDLADTMLLQLPGVYGVGIRKSLFTTLRFAIFTFESFFQSLAIFILLLAALQEPSAYASGRVVDKATLGVMAGLIAIFVSNLYVGINLNSWNILAYLAIHGSNAFTLLYTAVYATFPSLSVYGANDMVLASPQFWLVCALCIVVCLAPRILAMACHREFAPTDIMIAQEMQLRQRLQECEQLKRQRPGAAQGGDPFEPK